MGVTKHIITEGSGPSPQRGDTISMLYTGYLKNKDGSKGNIFDSTAKRNNDPFVTKIGVGQLIKGWDEGVPTMKVGEKAELDITSDFAYGSSGVGGGLIPPNADLIFEVQLLKIN